MRHLRAKHRQLDDLMGMGWDQVGKARVPTGTRIRKKGNGRCRLQEHLAMARMARLGPGLAALGRFGPPLTFDRRCIGGRRAAGVGGVPMQVGFEGIDLLEEREELLPYACGGLIPIFLGDAESRR